MTRLYSAVASVIANARQMIACGIVVAFGVGMLFNAGSNLAETADFSLAQRLNPFNYDAVLTRINTQLREMDSSEKTGRVRNSAKWAITLSPRDPRGYSALALAEDASGNTEKARALFEYALEISNSEPIALRWLAAYSIEAGDFETALDRLDILSRRWPGIFAQALPLFDAILADAQGQTALAERHIVRSKNREQLLRYLIQTESGTQVAAQYLLRLHQRGAEYLGPHIVETEQALFNYGHEELAQTLFQFTLSERSRLENGFVFNGRFGLPAHGSPFDWNIVHTPGVAQVIEPGGLRLQFLNAPTRLGSARQVLMLPEGRYRLRVKLEARAASTPDAIYAELTCRTRLGEELIAIHLPDGTYRAETFEAEFTIPPGACPIQRLQLTNRVSTLNWSRPNTGEMILREISVERGDTA